MYVIYLIGDTGIGRYTIRNYSRSDTFGSECIWIVPGTIDPKED